MSTLEQRCPCLSGDTYSACCGRFHSKAALPPTAEWLMRSRYSAFACGDAHYLLNTWHPLTRPDSLELAVSITWRRLDILRTVRGSLLDTEGIVEFIAHYREDGISGQQHESSRFLKEGRAWYYLDAVSDDTPLR
ncbi:YchJ family protein [Cryobacterium sp. PH29-G1]|uniref:YchJ family protein n=1 Tax=Cryobacterium sp. PH29-G1 TaxID=3046211 RepID=UPI0024BA74CC|nr:YchJ family protein [Cryobacterium sp. PH29-G1]MDJ0350482.1 YchJ family protein [Cryobacterium sp. PH29-G1]